MKEALATWEVRAGGGRPGREWMQEKTEIIGSLLVARPAGNETHSPIRHVWVYITGVTVIIKTRESLRRWRVLPERMSGAGAALGANWRGGYCFIPTERDDVLPLLRRAKRRSERAA